MKFFLARGRLTGLASRAIDRPVAPVFPGRHAICRPATFHGLEPPPVLPSLGKRARIELALPQWRQKRPTRLTTAPASGRVLPHLRQSLIHPRQKMAICQWPCVWGLSLQAVSPPNRPAETDLPSNRLSRAVRWHFHYRGDPRRS